MDQPALSDFASFSSVRLGLWRHRLWRLGDPFLFPVIRVNEAVSSWPSIIERSGVFPVRVRPQCVSDHFYIREA